MPTIGMKIVSGSSPTPDINLPPVTTVKVGDPVLFIWHLPTSSGKCARMNPNDYPAGTTHPPFQICTASAFGTAQLRTSEALG